MDGPIDIERLADVTFVDLPDQAAEESKAGLFRLEGETEAVRVLAMPGRRSVQSIEVRAGLGRETA